MSVEREALLDEIALRRASIADAQREFEADDLTADQLAALVARESTSIERCEVALAALVSSSATSPAVRPAPIPRRHRRGFLIVALVCFAAAAVTLLIAMLAPRQPGGSDTGSISTTRAQHVAALLREAEIDQVQGNVAAALAAFNDALVLDPRNIEALTQSGWLSFSAGTASRNLVLVRLGEARVARAVSLAPTDPDPRLYYAIVAASTPGEKVLATQAFRKFLTLKPSTTLLALARPWLIQLGLPTS